MTSSQIRSYSLGLVIETAPGSTVNYQYQSAQTYYLSFESNFLVLPDEKTLVAPFSSNPKLLYSEDITQNNPTQIGTLTNYIYTVLYDEASKTLFAGDDNGYVIQYQKAENSASFSKSKDYGNLGIGSLYSSTLVNGLAIFGGSNNSIIAIDIKTKTIYGSVVTAYKYIYSLTPCKVSKSRTLLSVCGGNPNYSDTSTDIFQICLDSKSKNDVSQTPSVSSNDTQEIRTLPTLQSVSNQKVVDSIICGLHEYVKGLFCDFTKVYLDKLRDLQGKFS